jgi:tripartite-type tricarboxylate transporter receptor subunit TctC
MTRVAKLTCIAFALIFAASAARCDDVAEFYRNKPITLVVSASAGGAYDTLARTLARFLGRHVPGRPIVIVRNMAGGGGIAAANHLYGAAEKDGSAVGLLQNNTAFEPVLGSSVSYDPLKFAWLGTPSSDTGLFAVWHAVPVASIEDLRSREITVGAAGQRSTAASYARLFAQVFGARLKIVNGFPGQTEAFYAMERGELDGYAAVLYDGLLVSRPDWIAKKEIKVLVHYGPVRRTEFGPYAGDLVSTDEDHNLLDVAFAPLALGRPLAMPPGVPSDRLEAMRRSLAETFADPQFLAETHRLGLSADMPRSGGEIEGVIRRVFAMPARVLDRWRGLTLR